MHICKKFLTAVAAAYNDKARVGAKIARFDILKKRWDFRSNPLDPHYGDLVGRFIFDVGEAQQRAGAQLQP
jgi:hypothetical protein